MPTIHRYPKNVSIKFRQYSGVVRFFRQQKKTLTVGIECGFEPKSIVEEHR